MRRARPSRPASACSFSILGLNLVLTHGISPDFRGGVDLFIEMEALNLSLISHRFSPRVPYICNFSAVSWEIFRSFCTINTSISSTRLPPSYYAIYQVKYSKVKYSTRLLSNNQVCERRFHLCVWMYTHSPAEQQKMHFRSIISIKMH